jgi:hypothetical protein
LLKFRAWRFLATERSRRKILRLEVGWASACLVLISDQSQKQTG